MVEFKQNYSEAYVIEHIKEIIDEALHDASMKAHRVYGQLGDTYPCGFAWTSLFTFNGKRIKGNTKIGKALKAAGIEQSYDRSFQIWNPSGLPVQNVDIKEAGAEAAAEVFRRYGFESYAGSRLD